MNLPLFQEAHARSTDPQTSHEAAKSVVNLGEVRDKILHMLTNWPRTDEQLWERYSFCIKAFNWKPVSPSGLRSRRSELVSMGYVVDSGQRAKTHSGRQSIVWQVAK